MSSKYDETQEVRDAWDKFLVLAGKLPLQYQSSIGHAAKILVDAVAKAAAHAPTESRERATPEETSPVLTTMLAAAAVVLEEHHEYGATCSQVGIVLYGARTTTCNRAREGGALLRRLRDLGLADRSSSVDGVHTVYRLTALGARTLAEYRKQRER